MSTDTIRVIIADDHPAIVMGVQHELQKDLSLAIVARAGTPPSCSSRWKNWSAMC